MFLKALKKNYAIKFHKEQILALEMKQFCLKLSNSLT